MIDLSRSNNKESMAENDAGKIIAVMAPVLMALVIMLERML